MDQGPTAPAVSPALRGSTTRATDWMEQFQVGYVRAVAAAAGCNVHSVSIDEGVDVVLSHTSPGHAIADRVFLEVQLKATASFAGSVPAQVSAQMSAARYDEFRSERIAIDRIVVVMSMPDEPERWVRASHKRLALRHCAYWVNLRGQPASEAKRPVIHAQTSNIFDDIALCGIMERIGKGGTP